MPKLIRDGRNVRHDIDPNLIKISVDKQIELYEHYRIMDHEQKEQRLIKYEKAKLDGTAIKWLIDPTLPNNFSIDVHYDELIDREKSHHSAVRVIELPKNRKRFILVYGDTDDTIVRSGTGPFETVNEATEWFINNGR